MKTAPLFLACAALLLAFGGCRSKQAADRPVSPSTDLKTYLRTVKLPKDFSAAFDPAKVKAVSSAKIYPAAYLAWDADQVKTAVLGGAARLTRTNERGSVYETSSGSVGGSLTVTKANADHPWDWLTYAKKTDGKTVAPDDMIPSYFGFPDPALPYRNKSNYPSAADLSFLSRREAAAKVAKVLADAGAPPLALSEEYTLDFAHLTGAYALYRQSMENIKAPSGVSAALAPAPTQNDECYLLFFRQTLDGIPLANEYWPEGTRTETDAMETQIYAVYSRDGLSELSCQGLLYRPGSGGKAQTLLTPAQGLSKVIAYYSGILPDGETKVVSMELQYVAVDADSGYTLIPAWVFGISAFKGGPHTQDSYYVVNAVTGNRIEIVQKSLNNMPGAGGNSK